MNRYSDLYFYFYTSPVSNVIEFFSSEQKYILTDQSSVHSYQNETTPQENIQFGMLSMYFLALSLCHVGLIEFFQWMISHYK